MQLSDAEAALPAHLFALAESPGLALGFFPSELCTGITDDWDAAPQNLSTSCAQEGCYTSSVQRTTLVTAGGIPPGLQVPPACSTQPFSTWHRQRGTSASLTSGATGAGRGCPWLSDTALTRRLFPA